MTTMRPEPSATHSDCRQPTLRRLTDLCVPNARALTQVKTIRYNPLPLLAAAALFLWGGWAASASVNVPNRSELLESVRAEAAAFPKLKADPHFAAVLKAIAAIPRERFMPYQEAAWAYVNSPVPIGAGQTISAPSVVALMTSAARIDAGMRVLEIGTGSGYQAAVLATLRAQVYTIEIVDTLANAAAVRLQRLGYSNVEVRSGDGFNGWSEKAPFDAILVTAGSIRVPQPLIDQLRVGGRLIMPIGPVDLFEQLMVFEKLPGGSLKVCSLGRTSFVPLTGIGEAPASRSGEIDRKTPYCFGGRRPHLLLDARDD